MVWVVFVVAVVRLVSGEVTVSTQKCYLPVRRKDGGGSSLQFIEERYTKQRRDMEEKV